MPSEQEWNEYARDAEAEIGSLKARLAEAERDAARYRWLRDCDCPFNVYLYEGADDTGWSPECGSSLDKAIDTAMQEGKR